ncbi:TMEM165/GDT1 family protein [Comamonas aquatilis]
MVNAFWHHSGPIPLMIEAFLVSTSSVTLAEMGDKTQLLSLVLAAKYRKPMPIVLGILVATLVNHALAGAVGAWIASVLGADVLRWILGISFIAMAAWMLIPDQFDDESVGNSNRWGIFGTTVMLFFLAEMGDKTQLATVGLAAKYVGEYFWVIVGTTLGMMLANAPVVWWGDKITKKLPIRIIHRVCAAIFLVLGLAVLFAPAIQALV